MPKQKLIKISKPIQKVQIHSDESEFQPETTATQQIELQRQLQDPLEIDHPISMSLTCTNSSGWKASDILL